MLIFYLLLLISLCCPLGVGFLGYPLNRIVLLSSVPFSLEVVCFFIFTPDSVYFCCTKACAVSVELRYYLVFVSG